MSLYSELLFDMNALSYLDKLVILPQALGCVERPLTSDLIRYKEMSHENSRPRWEEVERCGMMSLPLAEDEMFDVLCCMQENKGLSLYDAGLLSADKVAEICKRICAELLPKRYDSECERICERFMIAEED